MTLTHPITYHASVGNVPAQNQGESNMPGYGMNYGKKATSGKKKKKPMRANTTGSRKMKTRKSY